MIIGLVIFFLVLACVVVGSVIYLRRMKTKSEKRNEARKNAEALKAKRKANREAKSSTMASNTLGRKGKSAIPQSKKKK